jgi:hypothetical protein
MWHSVLITLHAVAGTIAFVAGCVALRRGTLFATYLWSLVAAIGFVALAVVEEWGRIDWAARLPFLALLGLGAVMLVRAELARRIQQRPSPAYVGHVGFTLVALFDAFAVVTILNAGAAVWIVVAAGVAIALVGHLLVVRAENARQPGLSGTRA